MSTVRPASRPRRFQPDVLRLGLAALLGACAAPAEDVACDDETCPANQACQDGACSPIAPPTATGELGRYTGLAFRADGRRVLATYDATFTNLVLLTETPGGTFASRVVDGFRIQEHEQVDVESGRWASIAVDGEDRVHMTWYDGFEGALRYGRLDPDDALSVETVDGADDPNRGTHTSLAVDAAGNPHVAYRDESARGLRYACKVGGAWASEPVPSCAGEPDCPGASEDSGEFASLALVGGLPRVAFYDRLRGDLKMAERTGPGAWSVTTLDGRDPATGLDNGDVGRFARVALDPKQRLGIAYYDATRSSLRYLFPSGPSPVPLVVDAGVYTDPSTGALRSHPVGQHLALAFDESGRATLVYLDAGRLLLKIARVDGILGAVVDGPYDLPELAAGVHPAIAVSGGVVTGAYGAWAEPGSTRTTLRTFEVASEGTP